MSGEKTQEDKERIIKGGKRTRANENKNEYPPRTKQMQALNNKARYRSKSGGIKRSVKKIPHEQQANRTYIDTYIETKGIEGKPSMKYRMKEVRGLRETCFTFLKIKFAVCSDR